MTFDSEIRFIRVDADLILVKAVVDTTEQNVLSCTAYDSIRAVYSQNLKHEESCIYHLLRDENNKILPVYQRPGINHTCSIVLEETFDEYEVLITKCANGIDGPFNLRSIILKKGDEFYHWMGKTLTKMGKRLAQRVFYNDNTKELVVFSYYPTVIKNVINVEATDNEVVYSQNDVMCRKKYRHEAWEDSPL